MQKRKVLFVSNTMGWAGAEIAMTVLMKELQNECEISLYSLIPRGEMYTRLPEGVRILNRRYSVNSVQTAGGSLFIARTLLGCFFRHGAGARCVREMIRTLRLQRSQGKVNLKNILWRLLAEGAPRLSEQFDLAIANLEGASSYYVADAVHAKKKVGFIHIDYGMAGYSAELDHHCFERFDAVFPISKSVRESFLKEYPQLEKRVYVFDNLMDKERIRNLSVKEKGFRDGDCPFRILTLARLHPQKALDVSIRAAERMRDQGFGFRWYIAGEGSERAYLERLIRKFHLEDRFILLGFVRNPYPLLREADLYVHATAYEGKSIAIAEAQILKKPIIASDIPGNHEFISSGINGLLVPLEPMDIASAVMRLASDRALREKFSKAAGLEDSTQNIGMEVLKTMLKE